MLDPRERRRSAPTPSQRLTKPPTQCPSSSNPRGPAAPQTERLLDDLSVDRDVDVVVVGAGESRPGWSEWCCRRRRPGGAASLRGRGRRSRSGRTRSGRHTHPGWRWPAVSRRGRRQRPSGPRSGASRSCWVVRRRPCPAGGRCGRRGPAAGDELGYSAAIRGVRQPVPVDGSGTTLPPGLRTRRGARPGSSSTPRLGPRSAHGPRVACPPPTLRTRRWTAPAS